MDILDNISSLITAISQFAWPITILIIVNIYKDEIRKLFDRKIKFKIGGQEFELSEIIDKFQQSVQKSGEEVIEKLEPTTQSEENEILKESVTDPKLGIIVLAKNIDEELRNLYASMGMLNHANYVSSEQALRIMVQKGYIPEHTISSLEIFNNLRSVLIHSNLKIDNKEIIRVLDIGMILLRTLKSIPHEINTVYQPDVNIYSDKDCRDKLPEAKGLILETTSPGGVEKTFRIYPTTKIGYYKKGKQVAWEWDLSKTWNKTWYIDPKAKEKRPAWDSAGEFIGRHLDEI